MGTAELLTRNHLIRDTFGKPKHIRLATAKDLQNNLPGELLKNALGTQSNPAPGSDKWILIRLGLALYQRKP